MCPQIGDALFLIKGCRHIHTVAALIQHMVVCQSDDVKACINDGVSHLDWRAKPGESTHQSPVFHKNSFLINGGKVRLLDFLFDLLIEIAVVLGSVAQKLGMDEIVSGTKKGYPLLLCLPHIL